MANVYPLKNTAVTKARGKFQQGTLCSVLPWIKKLPSRHTILNLFKCYWK